MLCTVSQGTGVGGVCVGGGSVSRAAAGRIALGGGQGLDKAEGERLTADAELREARGKVEEARGRVADLSSQARSPPPPPPTSRSLAGRAVPRGLRLAAGERRPRVTPEASAAGGPPRGSTV